MLSSQAQSVYRNAATQAQIHPVKLVHLMYERILLHLENTIQAIEQKNVAMRGENLGKAIALVSELNVAIKVGDDSEAAVFLRGLYASILVELPKVAVSDDAQTVRLAHGYISGLKELWERTAMRENGLEATPVKSGEKVESAAGGYGNEARTKVAVGGLSVAI